MNHPPYHLRPNKAVDRFLLVETLRVLSRRYDFSNYTYFGFGGPFLEDCRLLNEHCPELALVSLEAKKQTYKRQRFHRFSRRLDLRNCTFQDFLPDFCSKGKEIFWIDYPDLSMSRFAEFMEVLEKSEHGTIVKITLRAQCDDNPYSATPTPGENEDDQERRIKVFREEFERVFAQVLPAGVEDSAFRPGEFPELVQRMLQVAAEKSLPASCGSVFQPLHSAYYTDGTWMVSLSGIVCGVEEISGIRADLKAWKLKNSHWTPPYRIDVPVLSVKERLLLEKLLPIKSNTGKALAKALGYRIGDSGADNLRKLQQYADFHRYYPYFAKVTV